MVQSALACNRGGGHPQIYSRPRELALSLGSEESEDLAALGCWGDLGLPEGELYLLPSVADSSQLCAFDHIAGGAQALSGAGAAATP